MILQIEGNKLILDGERNVLCLPPINVSSDVQMEVVMCFWHIQGGTIKPEKSIDIRIKDDVLTIDGNQSHWSFPKIYFESDRRFRIEICNFHFGFDHLEEGFRIASLIEVVKNGDDIESVDIEKPIRYIDLPD